MGILAIQWIVMADDTLPQFLCTCCFPSIDTVSSCSSPTCVLESYLSAFCTLMTHAGQAQSNGVIQSHWYFTYYINEYFTYYTDGLVQDCSNSSVLAMELLQSCTQPLISVNRIITIYSLSRQITDITALLQGHVSDSIVIYIGTVLYD